MSNARSLPLLALACTFVSASAARAATEGAWYVVEVGGGTIAEFTGGGDVGANPDFVSGLTNARGMCWGGAGPDLFVTERSSGEIYAVTDGGDVGQLDPFATGLGNPGPYSLDCTQDRVLAANFNTGEVFDVTAGGDFTGAVPFATAPPATVDVFTDAEGTIWLTTRDDGLFDISAGGSFTPAMVRNAYDAGGLGIGDIAEVGGTLYVAELMAAVGGGAVRDISGLAVGAQISLAPQFATGIDFATGSLGGAGDELYIGVPCPGGDAEGCSGGFILDIAGGGDFAGAVPFASNVEFGGFFIESLVYTHYCGDGIVWANSSEECDDGNRDAGDGCDPGCALEDAGATTGTTDGGGMSSGGVETSGTGRGSDGGIDDTTASVDAGATDDDSAGADETGGFDTTGAPGGASTGLTTAPSDGESGADSGSGGAPAGADDEATGCSCRGSASPASGGWWLLLAGLVVARRRSAVEKVGGGVEFFRDRHRDGERPQRARAFAESPHYVAAPEVAAARWTPRTTMFDASALSDCGRSPAKSTCTPSTAATAMSPTAIVRVPIATSCSDA